MGSGRIGLKNVRLSLADLTGADYARALCEARAFLTGGSLSAYQALAEERVDFFPDAFQERLDQMLDAVGKPVVAGLSGSAAGAATQSVRKATKTAMAPLGGFGFYRVGEDGRLYLITKSEHYHAPLGHSFPGDSYSPKVSEVPMHTIRRIPFLLPVDTAGPRKPDWFISHFSNLAPGTLCLNPSES